jgi:D-serine deaminase-like pyridoxal phosphate-dependent protein
MKLHEIPTPALIVDLPAMQRNIDRMAAYFAGRTSKLRPHFKAHKTPAIAKRQLAAGNCTGLTCATVGEAEVVARERLCDEILIANEIVGPGKAARAAKLAGETNLIVAVDSDYGLDDIAAAARAAGTTVGVLVDVGVGLPRCGIAPGEPAVALAKRVDAMDGVVLRGVMGYEGHVVAIEDRADREEKAAKAMERLLSTARMVREAGLRCDIVSGGGTGTYDITGGMEGITEVQAGSYVLMDTAYAKLDIPFEMAFMIRGTVLSRPRPEQCATDTGLKACAVDHGNPSVKDVDGAQLLFLSDEHATIVLPADSPIAIGDTIDLWPSHIDPTINLHDVLYAVEGGEVVEVWPITARSYPEHLRTLGYVPPLSQIEYEIANLVVDFDVPYAVVYPEIRRDIQSDLGPAEFDGVIRSMAQRHLLRLSVRDGSPTVRQPTAADHDAVVREYIDGERDPDRAGQLFDRADIWIDVTDVGRILAAGDR